MGSTLRHDARAVSTIKEPTVITFQLSRVLPEKRAGFLSRMVRGLRNLALRMGVGSPGRVYYGDSQVLSLKEKTEIDAAKMGLLHL